MSHGPLDHQRQAVQPEAGRPSGPARCRRAVEARATRPDFTHYIHLHEELWRTLARDGHPPPPWERGYEDTWRLDPGESVVVAARFTDYTGNS